MGITKNALIRYQTLDRCFRNLGKNYYINDLLNECNKALLEFDTDCEGIKKRQLYDDIRFMKSSQGFDAPLERYRDGKSVYYRYDDLNFSIKNQPINELEAEQLKSAMLVLSRFKGLPQFEWINELMPKLDVSFNLTHQQQEIIGFETNEFLKGTEFITPLFNAILNHQTLKIKYQSFKSDVAQEMIFSSYYLKQYNNRWFLLGKDSNYENLINLALDRIQLIENTKEPYLPNESINFQDYFDDFIGVTKFEGQVIEEVTLLFTPQQAPYITTKPLHHSQRSKMTEEGLEVRIYVILNYELEKLILSFGNQVKVIGPEMLKNTIYTTYKTAKEQYISKS